MSQTRRGWQPASDRESLQVESLFVGDTCLQKFAENG